MRKFFEGTNSESLSWKWWECCFLGLMTDSFLDGPGVPTLSKERRVKKRVPGGWPQQDGGLTPIKDCQCEKGSLRMVGSLNWSYIDLWGSW